MPLIPSENRPIRSCTYTLTVHCPAGIDSSLQQALSTFFECRGCLATSKLVRSADTVRPVQQLVIQSLKRLLVPVLAGWPEPFSRSGEHSSEPRGEGELCPEMCPEMCNAVREPVYRVTELAASEYAYTDPLTTPVEELFAWDRELHELGTFCGKEFYLVVFRSVRKSTADSEMLYNADADAQEEARRSGGLLKYWYGILNERRECLAMCIWASREDAVKAIHQPAHRVAMKLASAMYDLYVLERYSLKIGENLVPTFTLLGSMSSS